MENKPRSNAPRGLNREKMRELYQQGYCVEAIARKFKCRTNAVMHHIYDLTVPCITMVSGNSKLTEKQVKDIRHFFIQEKFPATVLAVQFKVSESTILNVVHGVFYRWVSGDVVGKDGVIHEIPKNFFIEKISNKKGARKSGPNENTQRMVRSGALIPLAKKHAVATCTISRWMRNGKMSTSGKLIKVKVLKNEK